MSPKKLSKSVLKKIQKEQITPTARTYFIFRNMVIGGLGILFLVLGILACAIIIHFLNNAEFLEFVWKGPRQFLKLLWFGIPVFWIILLIGLVFITTYLTRKTPKGYKFPFGWALGAFLLSQIIGGIVLEGSNIGEQLDQRIARHISFYQNRQERRQKFWKNPENGFLAGTIIEINENGILLLDDWNKTQWTVDFTKSMIGERVQLQPDEKIRLIGTKAGNTEFIADQIRSWKRARGRGLRGKKDFRQPPRFEKKKNHLLPPFEKN